MVGDNGTVFSVSYSGGDGGRHRLTVTSARPRTEHMDRRCACGRWTRFYAAPQTTEVEGLTREVVFLPK